MSALFKWLLLAPIWAYRWFISPLTPPSCRFQPVCSAYAMEAIHRHGAWAGLWLAVKRLSHCHAWESLGGRHGFDPVPIEIAPVSWYAPWRVKGKTPSPQMREGTKQANRGNNTGMDKIMDKIMDKKL